MQPEPEIAVTLKRLAARDRNRNSKLRWGIGGKTFVQILRTIDLVIRIFKLKTENPIRGSNRFHSKRQKLVGEREQIFQILGFIL